jgi:hypothetical protein
MADLADCEALRPKFIADLGPDQLLTWL